MTRLGIVVEDSLSRRLAQVPLADHLLSVGRDPGCSIVLDSPYVSKRHAEIRPRQGGFALHPLGFNGTYLNRQPVREGEERPLKAGDVILLPGFTLRVVEPQAGPPGRTLERMREYSQFKASLHAALLEKVDLRTLSARDLQEEQRRRRIHAALDELLDERLQVAPDLAAFIVVEAFRRELIDRLLLGAANSRTPDGAAPNRADWSRRPQERGFAEILERLSRELGTADAAVPARERLAAIAERFAEVFEGHRPALPPALRDFLVRRAIRRDLEDLVFGLGPLEDLLRMPDLNEIMVIGRDRIFVEATGGLEETGRSFPGDDDLDVVIGRIVAPVGRFVNRAQPIVDARLADGSRVNIVVPPVSLRGPAITIRKFRRDPFSIDDLVANGTLNERALLFLRGCILTRKNLVLSGGTGSGKTTLLNTLASQIPAHERIVVIEDAAELQLRQPNLVVLEAKKANVEGEGEIPIRELVRAALRMRPDRIIVGECRGKEALDMLQAMNTGHDGSLTTGHSNSPQEMVSRLEVMALEADEGLPLAAIDRQIAGAVDVIVQIRRLRDGRRRVTQIAEVLGYDAEEQQVALEDIFRLGRDDSAELQFTGFLPTFIDEFVERSGTRLKELF